MTPAFKITYGAAALWSLMLVAANRDSDPPEAPAAPQYAAADETAPPLIQAEEFQDRWPAMPRPAAPPAPPAAPEASAPAPEPVVAHHHHHVRQDDVCANGRRYFYRSHHQYWRCRR